jgi:polyhydroxyalkanoate synthase subunit PhaC
MADDKEGLSSDGAAFWADALRRFDAVRRWRGNAMDSMGLGRQETAFRIVLDDPDVRLRLYGEQPASGGPVLLIVPAPIKRGYIWDLLPQVSVVRRYLDAGFRVYMTEWIEPADAGDADEGSRVEGSRGDGKRGSPLGLADYADRLILRCADAIAAAGDGDRLFIAGHSLGGTLATVFSSLHADRIRGLVVVEAPLHFGADSGVFAPVVAGAPHAAALRELFGNIPGTFLNMVSAKASPREFNWDRRMDMIASLANPRAFQTHLAVERWTLDEFPIPGRLFEELIEQLYRENRFARGTLEINGRTASPAGLTSPLLAILGNDSQIIPPAAMLPVIEAAPAANKRTVTYGGDVGVSLQHVGPLIGRTAHESVWPEVIGWQNDIVRAG